MQVRSFPREGKQKERERKKIERRRDKETGHTLLQAAGAAWLRDVYDGVDGVMVKRPCQSMKN